MQGLEEPAQPHCNLVSIMLTSKHILPVITNDLVKHCVTVAYKNTPYNLSFG